MPTFLDLKNTVISEVRRGDITPSIAGANINKAIRYFQRTPLYFNEGVYPFSTVAQQPNYPLPANVLDIYAVGITIGNRNYQLNPIDIETIRQVDGGFPILSGYPKWYALYAEEIVLYPRPNNIYIASVDYAIKLPELVNDSDASKWTNDAQDLIVNKAKFYIYTDLIKDYPSADAINMRVNEILKALLRESDNKMHSNILKVDI